MNRRRKILLLFLFLILVIDLLFFTVHPTFFSTFLTNFEPALGLKIVGGLIIAIVVSTALLFLFYKELKTIIEKPVSVETVHPKVEMLRNLKEFIEETRQKMILAWQRRRKKTLA